MPIQPIDKRSVHRLTSGQVIIDLATAVKELVENALDAHATRIEVKFKNYGMDSIEVIDNGDGIPEKDFEGIARKHHTSKLRTFEDIEKVATLGFRGEAMSSLCALANVSLVTLTKDSNVATKLVFDHSGEIISRTNAPGRKGTSVIFSDMFESVPVRRKFLEKNLKRQFADSLTLLQEYAIISEGVTFTASHTTGATGSGGGSSNRRNARKEDGGGGGSTPTKTAILVKSTGSNIRDNIISVFGATAIEGLVQFDLQLQSTVKSVIHEELDDSQTRIIGFISQPIHGKGRNSSDRQLFFVNSRPCKLPRIAKAINEIYRQFNTTQSPCVICNLIIDPANYDVNVSPDKRTILLHQESALVECIKERLTEFYEQSTNTVPRKDLTKKEKNVDDIGAIAKSTQSKLSYFKSGGRQYDEQEDDEEQQDEGGDDEDGEDGEDGENEEDDDNEEGEQEQEQESEDSEDDAEQVNEEISVELDNELGDDVESEVQEIELIEEQEMDDEQMDGVEAIDSQELGEIFQVDSSTDRSDSFGLSFSLPSQSSMESPEKRTRTRISTSKHRLYNLSTKIPTSRSRILKGWRKLSKMRNQLNPRDKHRHHHLGISTVDIDGNSDVIENRLNMTICKDDFSKMRVIGQFNLGFILVLKTKEDGTSDLFIIDQHASDEKANFERLQEETVMQHQPLVVPRQLDLTAVEELVLIKNLSLLEKNGFTIKVDEAALPGEQCKLVSLPFSKRTVFDETDLNELLYLIRESPGNGAVRCSKVRAMFAMRACRSSIMIGQSLTLNTMQKVVKRLAELDKPWSCPHGRPTLRHMISIDQWNGFNEDIILDDI